MNTGGSFTENVIGAISKIQVSPSSLAKINFKSNIVFNHLKPGKQPQFAQLLKHKKKEESNIFDDGKKSPPSLVDHGGVHHILSTEHDGNLLGQAEIEDSYSNTLKNVKNKTPNNAVDALIKSLEP
jgi:hypothetical protein